MKSYILKCKSKKRFSVSCFSIAFDFILFYVLCTIFTCFVFILIKHCFRRLVSPKKSAATYERIMLDLCTKTKRKKICTCRSVTAGWSQNLSTPNPLRMQRLIIQPSFGIDFRRKTEFKRISGNIFLDIMQFKIHNFFEKRCRYLPKLLLAKLEPQTSGIKHEFGHQARI